MAYYLYTRADVVILGKFGYITEIAYYNVVNKILHVAVLPFAVIGQVTGPVIAGYYAKKQYDLVRKDFVKTIYLLVFFGIATMILTYLFVPVIIRHFFPEYNTPEAMGMFYLLVWLLPFRVIAGYVSAAHTVPTGNAHYSLWTMILSGVSNVILDIIFISKFGFIGVVYSTLICYGFAITSFVVLYYFKLNRLTGKSVLVSEQESKRK